ncbi:MAG: DUF4097 family beta strand repeat-containing protein, partial [Candidatus Hydrogenedentes bacterium]|nr:DUF4097 family beta strand repeat-containing protein [Candidatus Hydrogenedentota bacterium]
AVQVFATSGDGIHIQANVRVYAQSSAAKLLAQVYAASLVYTTADSAVVKVVTEPRERPDDIEVRVDYSLLVPTGTDVEVEGSNGNVWVAKGCGRVTIQGKNSDIDIAEPSGAVDARSTNGRIRLVDASSDATLQTVNGSIYAHVLGGSLHATTTNGAIVAHVLDSHVKTCDLTTQNGGITVVMDEHCSARINAATGRGTITSDFSVATPPDSPKRHRLRGLIGEGIIGLNMATLNGNIWITRNSL